MSSFYLYSLSNDFKNGLDTTNLYDSINDDSRIIPKCLTISNFRDDVKIFFNIALSNLEKTILDTIVSQHQIMGVIEKYNFFAITLKKNTSKTPVYFKMESFEYNGSRFSNITAITVLSCMDIGATSYSVRIVDKTHNKIITELTGLTNTEYAIFNFDNINNIPFMECIFEVQAKINSPTTKFAYIDSINVYYDF